MLIVILVSSLIANIVGVAFHYVHKPTTKSLLVHIFTAVNESTWEHLKLAFTPMLIISIFQYFILKESYSNIFEANLYAIIGTMLFIPLIYYPVKFFLKREVLFVSIGIFVLAIFFGYFLSYLTLSSSFHLLGESGALLVLGLILGCFAEFTLYPPKMFLFWDPISKSYGHKLK